MAVYYGSFTAIAVTALQDAFELLCPTDAVCEILEVRLGQYSDEGDVEAEMLPVQFVRGHGTVTSGSGGGTITPVPTQKGHGASGATLERNNTTRMVVGSGALVTPFDDTFNIQVGFLWVPTPETRIFVSPGDRFTVALPVAPSDELTMTGMLTWDELGG